MSLEIFEHDTRASFFACSLVEQKIHGESKVLAQFMQPQDAKLFKTALKLRRILRLFSFLFWVNILDWHDYEREPKLGDFDEELQSQEEEEDWINEEEEQDED